MICFIPKYVQLEYQEKRLEKINCIKISHIYQNILSTVQLDGADLIFSTKKITPLYNFTFRIN